MTNLINSSAITATSVDGVYDQVIACLESNGYATANNADEVVSYLSAGGADVDLDDIVTRDAQTIQVDGELKGDWQSTITVIIAENYIESGSVDYIYTISVTED